MVEECTGRAEGLLNTEATDPVLSTTRPEGFKVVDRAKATECKVSRATEGGRSTAWNQATASRSTADEDRAVNDRGKEYHFVEILWPARHDEDIHRPKPL